MLRLFPFAFLAVALVLGGCKKPPKAGAKCSGDAPVGNSFSGACQGKGAALACIDGAYAELKCVDKPVGCMEVMGKVSCTQIVDEDEACFGDKKWGCSSDHKKMLECKGGKWSLKMACKSSKGCVENVEGVRCESAEAEEGDPCEADQKDSGSCSPDKKKLLVCNGKKFVVASTCRGQNKCRAVGSKLECDTSLAEIDDPCEQDGKLSCDGAKKVLLECNGKAFVKKQDCKKRCNNAFDKYGCE